MLFPIVSLFRKPYLEAFRCAEVVSLYLFWKRKLMAGLIVLLVPPIIVSTLIIKWVDLEAYRQSAFGRYIRAYITPFVVVVRLLGTVITRLGVWYRQPLLIPLGFIIILLAWLLGILWPKRTQGSGGTALGPITATISSGATTRTKPATTALSQDQGVWSHRWCQNPPVERMIWPVTHPASSLAKKVIRRAASSDCPTHPIGKRGRNHL